MIWSCKHLVVLALASCGDSRPITGWTRTESAVEPSAAIELRFMLSPQSPSALDEASAAVSEPSSPRFRKYLSDKELGELVAPPAGVLEAVQIWASEELSCGHGAAEARASLHGDALLVRAAVGCIKKRFGASIGDFAEFRHDHLPGLPAVRALPAQAADDAAAIVPKDLQDHVKAILGLVDLLPVPRHSARPNEEGQPGELITPDVISKQYHLTGAGAEGGKTKTSQAVAGFEQAQFRPEDVAAFEEAYKLPKVEVQVNGPNDGGYFGEASLDTQYIVATGRNVPTWFVSQDQFDLLSFCEKTLNMTAPPSVMSISWGSGESGYDKAHMVAANTCFQKMGLQGISVFTASGDEGTGKQGLFRCTKFDPVWPAASPFVTSVGGTYLESGEEKGWSGTGGGFSAVFPRPAYQDSVVEAFFNGSTALPASNLYSAGGRALPDVAAFSTNFQVYAGGKPGDTLTGTSAATPTFAGMVSLINDMLVAAGKPTVGFINPILYSQAAAAGSVGFDVTEGKNKHDGCPSGWSAKSGWDPVTGFGTPLFENLKKLLHADFLEDLVV
eukprot:TRINITY_DN31578_c0_g1_i3.p1 TRINITY_DN31578_c0_g1~~TRINITY_DN31578_c0_g1_i3.p1  ORF type:complete len:558 (+),score=97.98 TRINITY_DN31578_c0_g1_i3:106-1779(+)